MPPHLDVEHQVEPQDGEQEAGPGTDRRGHVNNLIGQGRLNCTIMEANQAGGGPHTARA
jgi:hypothetical protein